MNVSSSALVNVVTVVFVVLLLNGMLQGTISNNYFIATCCRNKNSLKIVGMSNATSFGATLVALKIVLKIVPSSIALMS